MNNPGIFYALKVSGRLVSRPVSDRTLLERQKDTLPESERHIAEIVSVTSDGKELLLG